MNCYAVVESRSAFADTKNPEMLHSLKGVLVLMLQAVLIPLFLRIDSKICILQK